MTESNSKDTHERLLAEIRDLQLQQLELMRAAQVDRERMMSETQREADERNELLKLSLSRQDARWRFYRLVVFIVGLLMCGMVYMHF